MTSDSIFSTWGLSVETLRAITEIGYEKPTPVQEAVIPHLLQKPTDLLALAKTGTGKTAAFGIPLVEHLTNEPNVQALVLCPTRELATQVAQSLQGMAKFKGLKVTTVLGGESYRKQIDSLKRGPQIVVSTPGRLIDLMEQKVIKLSHVKYLILDEADEMLSFGFQDALETVWKELSGKEVKTWLFSATMSESIKKLTKKYLKEPLTVTLNSATQDTSRVQSYAAVVFEEDKEDALCLLLKNTPEFYGIIFAQTKRQVGELELKLRAMGLDVDSLHGDKVQADRTRVVNRMKRKETKILVATDVAARGLDIEDLTHVVNYEIPWDVETYTHRIGRTARAGKTGILWTMVRPKEAHQLRKFERALKQDFKPLKIPSVKQVRENQILSWLKAVSEIEIPSKDSDIYNEIALKLQVDESMEMTSNTRDWLFKALHYMKVAADFEGKQPRSVELRAPSEDRRSDSRGFDGPPRRDRYAGRIGGASSRSFGSSSRPSRSSESSGGDEAPPRVSRPTGSAASAGASSAPLRPPRPSVGIRTETRPPARSPSRGSEGGSRGGRSSGPSARTRS